MSDHRSVVEVVDQLAFADRSRRFTMLLISGAAAVFSLVAWYEHERVEQKALHALNQTSVVAQQYVLRFLHGNEAALDWFLEILSDRSIEDAREDEQLLHRQAARITQSVPQVRNLVLWNEHGAPVVSARHYPVRTDLGIADRDYFVEHRQGLERSISMPVEGRLGNELIFNVSRLRTDAQGRFAGVVTASLSPGPLTEFYRHMASDRSGVSIQLVRRDGSVIVRYPESGPAETRESRSALSSMLGQEQSHDRSHPVSTGEGNLRYAAYQQVGSYPLFVVAGRSYADTFSEWRHDMLMLALFMLPGLGTLLVIIQIAARKARHEQALIIQAHENEKARVVMESQLSHLHKFEALGQLAGGIAHDFNNILHLIMNGTSALEFAECEVRKKYLASIRRAVDNGRSLISHLLAFSRQGGLRLECAMLQAVLPEMCELARHAVPSTVRLTCHVDFDTWPITVDLSELQLALINLIVNARDATDGRGTIAVEARNVTWSSVDAIKSHLPHRDFVALSVSDDGPGIPEAIIGRVFEPFFTTKSETQGTGLGLSRVYGYALRLGGTAVAQNRRPGGGAIFTLYIPRAEQVDAKREQSPRDADDSSASGIVHGSRR